MALYRRASVYSLFLDRHCRHNCQVQRVNEEIQTAKCSDFMTWVLKGFAPRPQDFPGMTIDEMNRQLSQWSLNENQSPTCNFTK